TILKEEAEDMKNTYSLLGVNPEAEAFAGTDVVINTEGANALIEWLQSDEAAELIAKYGVEEYGEQLFFLL
ncbi:MAG: tungsten ABC transporter substrate-binding protein, partial [Clostridia bacterium]|nr:tungsten ABC transporter substrate-binding protein [Clostridia bacterium]